jgi:hypothetical protein
MPENPAWAPLTEDPIVTVGKDGQPRAGKWTLPWYQFFANLWQTIGSGGVAPANAEYVVAAADPALTAERVLTDTASVTWDFSVAGQAKANAVSAPSSVMPVLTADPAAPANDTAWLFRDGGAPENLSLRVRRAGVTVDFPLGTF